MGGKSVVLFDTSLRGQRAHGLNVATCQPARLVTELTVFFRPLAAMQLVAAAAAYLCRRCAS